MRENLRRARKARGMSQRQVAVYLRVDKTYYYKIETGRAAGGVQMWDMLEDLFGVPQTLLREESHNPGGAGGPAKK